LQSGAQAWIIRWKYHIRSCSFHPFSAKWTLIATMKNGQPSSHPLLIKQHVFSSLLLLYWILCWKYYSCGFETKKWRIAFQEWNIWVNELLYKNWTDTKLIYFIVIFNIYHFNFSFIKLRVRNYALQSNGLKVLEVIKICSKTCVRNLKI